MFKRFIVGIMIAFSACISHAEDESVLWWMFDENTDIYEVNGIGSCKINELAGRGDAVGKTVNGIRIGAYSGDELLGYLVLGDEDSGDVGNTYVMPTFNMDTFEIDSWNAGPAYARIGDYSYDASIQFAIELGNLSGENLWDILAVSDKETYNSLYEKGWISGTLYEHGGLEWTGGSYSVPEPNSGILLLIGTGLLLLKRKSRKA
mgnify:CR=1 FL=1